jgi:hypothetical protein
LRSRSHAGEVRIFTIAGPGRRRLFGFFRFPLGAAFVFFFLLGLLGPFAIAFRESRFSWSGDRSLPA